jgi:hypothetical protein
LKVGIGVAAVALAVSGFAAGCGSGSDDTAKEKAERQATPVRAIAEIAIVRSALDTALATYRSGARAKADEQVGDAYLQHFELVEGPLERVDHELSEELEDGIRETLRDRIKAGAPAGDIAQLVKRIDGQLDEAKAALQQ